MGLEETNGQPVAPETSDERLARFAAAVAPLEEQPKAEAPEQITPPETADEPPVVDETPEAPGEAAAVVAEGPSDNMLAVARAIGIPEDVLATAASDRDVRLAMTLASRFQAPRTDVENPAAEKIAPDPDFQFEWPEDEVPPTDPLRRELERLHAFYKQRDAKREEEFTALAEYTVTKGRTEQQKAELAKQQEFDKLCDGLGVKELGDSKKLTPGVSPEWHRRDQDYRAFKTMTEQHGFTEEQAIQAIALRHGKTAAQPSISQVVREQAQTRLGGGSSRPAPEMQKSRAEKWAEDLAEKGIGVS
jgi:hypothetical protein